MKTRIIYYLFTICIICIILLLICSYLFINNTPTFHILIATGGRPSLQNMLDSLKNELTAFDAITVVFDGPDAQKKSEYNDSWISEHNANITIITQNPNLGAWGHPIRTKYQTMLTYKTTYIMHADDDDVYIPGSFNTLRNLCKDSGTLYIAKMNYSKKPNKVIPKDKTIRIKNIGTPNGIIPFNSAGKAEWQLLYGGDFKYYNKLQNEVKNVEFLDAVIYTVN